MARCTSTRDLEVHHKRRDGGNDLANAEVLCGTCHAKTSTYGRPGVTPPAFSALTRLAALRRAGNQCQCERKSCDHGTSGLWSGLLSVALVALALGAIFGLRAEDVRRFLGSLT